MKYAYSLWTIKVVSTNTVKNKQTVHIAFRVQIIVNKNQNLLATLLFNLHCMYNLDTKRICDEYAVYEQETDHSIPDYCVYVCCLLLSLLWTAPQKSLKIVRSWLNTTITLVSFLILAKIRLSLANVKWILKWQTCEIFQSSLSQLNEKFRFKAQKQGVKSIGI